MKYFTISELCKSPKAQIHNINNQPPPQVVDNLEILINECLDVIREEYGAPIYVNSGYRCEKLNKLVKGEPTSHHLFGFAADITTKNISTNKILFNVILKLKKEGKLNFTQLIDEYDYQWIHISYWKMNLKNQIIHKK